MIYTVRKRAGRTDRVFGVAKVGSGTLTNVYVALLDKAGRSSTEAGHTAPNFVASSVK